MAPVGEARRDDLTVKIDRGVAEDAKKTAALRGETLAEYLSGRLAPLVAADLAAECRRLAGAATPPVANPGPPAAGPNTAPRRGRWAGSAESRAERDAEARRLRAEGYTVAKVAEKLGIGVATASRVTAPSARNGSAE
jgi:hypothetical protein